MRRWLTVAIVLVIAVSFVVGGILLSEAPTPIASQNPDMPPHPGYPDFTIPPEILELNPSELANIRQTTFQLLSLDDQQVCAMPKRGDQCWDVDPETFVEEGLEPGDWVELSEVIGGRVVGIRGNSAG